MVGGWRTVDGTSGARPETQNPKLETKTCGAENAASQENKTWHLETLEAW